jgi:hypothetical protein
VSTSGKEICIATTWNSVWREITNKA